MEAYLDTSVFGGYFELEFEVASKALINKILSGDYSAVISDITLAELSPAPKYVRDLADAVIKENGIMITAGSEVKELAEKYIKEKIVTPKFQSDALHIALATVNKIDVVASWNFKHIVNLNRIRLYNSVNLKYGYGIIEIRSPLELI